MSFKKLQEALASGDTEKAAEIAKGLETDFNANVEEIGKLENKANEAIEGRNKVKEKLREITKAAGVDELTVDVIDDLKSKQGDDKLIAKHKEEIDTYAKRIEEIESGYKSKLGDANSRYQGVLIDRELTKLGASLGLADGAMDDVVSHLKQHATIDGDNIAYVIDGSPERNANGRPLTISDKIEELKTKKPFFFKAVGQGGSGQHHNGGGNAGKKFSELSGHELVALRRENPAEYERLKNQK